MEKEALADQQALFLDTFGISYKIIKSYCNIC